MLNIETAKESNSLDSFSKAVKPLVTHISKRGVSIRNKNMNDILIMCVNEIVQSLAYDAAEN